MRHFTGNCQTIFDVELCKRYCKARAYVNTPFHYQFYFPIALRMTLLFYVTDKQGRRNVGRAGGGQKKVVGNGNL